MKKKMFATVQSFWARKYLEEGRTKMLTSEPRGHVKANAATEVPKPSASIEELIVRATALVEVFRQRAPAADAAHRVSDANIEAIRSTDLARLLQPQSFGGYGATITDFIRVAEHIGAGCPSTAWVFANSTLLHWLVALFEEEAQREVWKGNCDTMLACSLAVIGDAEKVPGGYKLSGTWPFVSGVDHCDWCVVGATRENTDRRERPIWALVPKSALKIVDNWDVIGLAGTGSKDIELEGVFVPEKLCVPIRAARSVKSPGQQLRPDHSLYRIPLMAGFSYFMSGAMVGMARGALDVFLQTASANQKVFSTVQVRVGEATMKIDAARCHLLASATELAEKARTEDGVSLDQRMAARRAQAYAAQACVEAVDLLFAATGARGLFRSHPVQRYWRDVHAASAHFSVNWDAVRVMTGQHAVGADPELRFY